jgi:hypothetical protein
VLAAAEVRGTDADDVLDGADVEVLVGIAGRARALDDPGDVAAEVLVGIAAGRPFAAANGAAAWLAAMHALAVRGFGVEVTEDDAVALVHGAAAGHLVERDVASCLRPLLVRAPSRLRRSVRTLARRLADTATATRPVAVRHEVCPACARTIGGSPRWPLGPATGADDRVLVAVCAREHGCHDARGRPRDRWGVHAATRWCPIVRGPAADGPLLALTDDGPVALVPTLDGGGAQLDVLALGELAPSDLVGSWERLGTRGELIARVPADACRLDDARTTIDWHRVMAAVRRTGDLISA